MWLQKSSEQGRAEAQALLGTFYFDGDGVLQDYGEAFNLFDKAAKQGYATAQALLGNMYIHGKGTKKDDEIGYAWLNLAASQGAEFRSIRDAVGDKLGSQGIKRAQKLSREYQLLYAKE